MSVLLNARNIKGCLCCIPLSWYDVERRAIKARERRAVKAAIAEGFDELAVPVSDEPFFTYEPADVDDWDWLHGSPYEKCDLCTYEGRYVLWIQDIGWRCFWCHSDMPVTDGRKWG